MLGIEITSENLSEIIQIVPPTTDLSLAMELDRFIASPREWYFITGYVTRYGRLIDWTIIPGYVLEDVFDYDADKIKTDWTNVVRIEKAP